MPTPSVFGTRVTSLFGYPLAVVTLCALFVPGAGAQDTKRTVTVDVTKAFNGNPNTPTVIVDKQPPPPTECTFDQQPNPNNGDVYICPGYELKWTVKTKGDHGEITIFDADSVVVQTGTVNSKPQWFNGQTGMEVGGTISGSASAGSHKYVIAVNDPGSTNQNSGQTFHVYLYDPVIVIGSGTQPQSQKKKPAGRN